MGDNVIPHIHDRSVNLTTRLRSISDRIGQISWGEQPKDNETGDALKTGSCLSGIDEELISAHKIVDEITKNIDKILSTDKVG